jgi:adenylate cyclase
MNARLERRLHLIGAVVAASIVAGVIFVVPRGGTSLTNILVSVVYSIVISLVLVAVELVLRLGPPRAWINGLPFTASVLIRSAIYAAVILPLQYLDLGAWLTDAAPGAARHSFWEATFFSGAIAIGMNLAFAIANLIGPRALTNFVTGRYHHPSEENRFVLFVDIVGSTGLAERLGGIGIHRFLDRTFRLLTEAVVDYRGEVLGYVGDELIVTWPETSGATDARPLRCFLAMRQALVDAAPRFEQEFGAAPRIRGSLNFGPVIVGEIGDIKRAIVFNGDVMNTAARLEEQSRNVDGGFLAARAAVARLDAPLPVPLRDLGKLAIRGRVDGIDVVALSPSSADPAH